MTPSTRLFFLPLTASVRNLEPLVWRFASILVIFARSVFLLVFVLIRLLDLLHVWALGADSAGGRGVGVFQRAGRHRRRRVRGCGVGGGLRRVFLCRNKSLAVDASEMGLKVRINSWPYAHIGPIPNRAAREQPVVVAGSCFSARGGGACPSRSSGPRSLHIAIKAFQDIACYHRFFKVCAFFCPNCGFDFRLGKLAPSELPP